ncbi:MAG: 4-hydroxythreonine-4-phosphate dehydrogenase PdxA [Planctomycetaceae bacterium]
MKTKPTLAITLGDVAGIGPEVTARACADSRVRAVCRPLVVGHPAVLKRALVLAGSDLHIVPVASPEGVVHGDGVLSCWAPAGSDAGDVPPGGNDPRAGRAAYEWLVAAAQAALDGKVQGIVTAPLSKKALALAGLPFPGHTEILAKACGRGEVAMMLYVPGSDGAGGASDELRVTSDETGGTSALRTPHSELRTPLAVAHVTLHTSLASVPGLLSRERVRGTIELVHRFLVEIGLSRSRIGVCALNPHAGEEGLFGDEESRLIAPAVEDARQAEIDAHGPIPADALLRRAVAGEFEGVVAMYHDQGHIALKLVAFDRAVNVTLGLPIVRTSPSHGTAFDIAWTGRARGDGMIAAIRTAAELAARRVTCPPPSHVPE